MLVTFGSDLAVTLQTLKYHLKYCVPWHYLNAYHTHQSLDCLFLLPSKGMKYKSIKDIKHRVWAIKQT